MKELDGEKILLYVVGVMTVAILAPVIQKAPRTARGTNVLFHLGFVGTAVLLILLIPPSIKSEFFSPGGVVVVGTFLPVCKRILLDIFFCCWATHASLMLFAAAVA